MRAVTARPGWRSDRRARAAVATLFLTNGALLANLLPRYPEIKADLGSSNALYGISIAAFSAGALTAGPTAALLIRRFRSSRVAVLGSLVIAVFLLGAAVAPSSILFAAALFVAGAADALTDVAQNAHGLRVQRNYGRSIINSLHAVWSAGAVVGALMGAGAIALHIPRGVHLAVSAVVFSALCLVASRYLLPGADGVDTRPHPHAAHSGQTARSATARPATYAALAALVGIAVADAVVEDAGNSWATLYARELGAPGAIAAFGFVALVGFQFIGRLLGDRLVNRFGERAVARMGGLIVAVGMGIALAYPTVPGTVAGFGAAGFGVATLVPAAMHRADELPGFKPGTGLTALGWLMRFGFLLSPPVVGMIADVGGLRLGLLTVPAAGVAVIVLAGALSTARRGRCVTR